MQLSPFFFAADAAGGAEPYRLMIDVARFADDHGFTAVWTPERHFQRFGGPYGSPSVTSAALAVLTRRISIRAGSVVLPLQHALRVAEEWAMIDVLSGGRAAIAIAFGWHVNDFVLSPSTYATRHEDADAKLLIIQRLWRGEAVSFPNGEGHPIDVVIRPRPIQPQLPMWLTGKSEELFAQAAKLGLNVLTANFQWKSPAALARQIGVYRQETQRLHGRPGHVTLMAHAYAGADEAMVEAVARPAMVAYLLENLEIKQAHANAKGTGGTQLAHIPPRLRSLTDREREVLVAAGLDANLRGPLSFIGTPDRCTAQMKSLAALGVDEIACLTDFGIGHDDVMQSLARLAELIR